MKRTVLVVLAVALITAVVSAQLVITSLNQNGELTWTNSVSNATYRVEWAGSSTGPWQRMDVLTNLTSISATSNTVTVKVPMFHRVVWTDAPAHAGTWNYWGSNWQGDLISTGSFTLSAETNPIKGTWAFVPGGSGELRGSISNSVLHLDSFPLTWASDFLLHGDLSENRYTGRWSEFGGIVFWSTNGPFVATKQNPAP